MSKYRTENIKSVEIQDEYFLLNWHVTGWCNFHCPYCINQEFSSKYTPEDKVIEMADKLNNFLINEIPAEKKIQIRLIGGEPSYYDWPKILEHFKRVDRITMVTNFSRDNKFFEELYEYCYKRNIYFFLICSWHEEADEYFREKVADLTKWCRQDLFHKTTYKVPQVALLAGSDFSEDKIKSYTDLGITKIRISILRDADQNHVKLTPEQLKLIYDWNKKYEDNNKEIYARKGWSNRGYKVTFVDGSVEFFVNPSHLTNLMEDGGLVPDGFYCTSGRTNMVCMPNGDIIINKCDFFKDIVWGNILKDNVKLPENDLICNINEHSGVKKKCTLCSGINIYKK